MWTRWPGTLALCALATGCQLASNAVHNLTYEAKLNAATVQEHCTYEKLARASWQTVQTEHPDAFPSAYADGFKDGFVDYLQYGGSGQPPYMLPKRFWGPHYRTAAGYQAIEQWFAGFRHGAAAAQQSGYRQWATLPSAQATAPPPQLPAATVYPAPGMAAPLENSAPAPLPSLPPPRVVPPSEPKPPTNNDSVPPPQISIPLLGAPVEVETSTREVAPPSALASWGPLNPKNTESMPWAAPDTPCALGEPQVLIYFPDRLATFGILQVAGQAPAATLGAKID